MRTTDDKKESTIILRVNDDMRSYLEKCAQKEGVKLSAYVREVLEKSQKGIKCNTEYERNTKYDSNVQDSLDDIERMVRNSGGEFGKFLNRLQEQLFWEELSLENGEIVYDAELKDTLRMVELSSSKEEVPLFLKDLHDRLESGELQIKDGKLKLGYSEVFEVLNRAETKKWLKGVWNMCEEKGLDYKAGLRSVFEMGSKAVISGMGSQQEVNYIP